MMYDVLQYQNSLLELSFSALIWFKNTNDLLVWSYFLLHMLFWLRHLMTTANTSYCLDAVFFG
jgi:hypothetical protein